jgi:hypothetical protein
MELLDIHLPYQHQWSSRCVEVKYISIDKSVLIIETRDFLILDRRDESVVILSCSYEIPIFAYLDENYVE